MPTWEVGIGSGHYAVLEVNASGGSVTARVGWRRSGGSAYRRWNYGASWAINIGGQNYSGSFSFDSPASGNSIGTQWVSSQTRTGLTGNVTATGTINVGVPGVGSGSPSGTVSTSSTPPAPINPKLDMITPSSMRLLATSAGAGTGTFQRWEYQVSTSAAFTGAPLLTGVASPGGNLSVTNTTLLPGTRYYWRIRGVSSVGNGAWSAVVNALTINGGGHIRIGGAWKVPVPHVRVGGVWKPAIPYIRVGGVWKVAN